MPHKSISQRSGETLTAGTYNYTIPNTLSLTHGEREELEEARNNKSRAAQDAQEAEAIRQRNTFLDLFSAKLTGPSADVLPPLEYSADTRQRAVILATVPIVYGHFDVSQRSYHLLAKHVGMSLNSVSHWAICVVDRGFATCWCYDLMSDQLSLSMLGKSYLRVYEANAEIVASWTSAYYVGETTKAHEAIQELGRQEVWRA